MVLQSFKKTQLRHNVREKINSLTFEQILSKSKDIYNRLLDLDVVKNSKSVFIFISLKDEVQTFDLIEYFQKNWKQVLVPKIVWSELKIVKLNPKTKLVHWKFWILEPKTNNEFNWIIDLAIVPWLAFSIDWKRLWKWSWYYDKLLFLDKVIYKIWVCFDFQLLDDNDIPIELHDCYMNAIISDKK